jgi:tyrosine-protein phosphatase YwqE
MAFNLFKKKDKLPNAEQPLEPILVDMHSHLIPGIDDGVENEDAAIEMIRQFEEWGYKKLITTPHAYGDLYRNTPEIILPIYEKLINRIEKEGIKISLEVSSEYYLDGFFQELLNKNQILPFGKNNILVETGFMQMPSNFNELIFNARIAGYNPILAHPERYVYLHFDFDKYHELHDTGLKFQINISSLSGYYSTPIKKIAEKLIEKGLVDYLATDLHGIRHIKPTQDGLQNPIIEKLENSKILNNSFL